MALDVTIKVLIVEDSGITRKMEVKALKSLGYQRIVEAGDGNEAYEKLKNEGDVGLIISDWNMPGMSGFDFLKTVRADSAFQSVPFIMATAQGEKKQTAAATDAGVSNFITKPFGPPELQAVIEDTFRSPEERPTKKQAEDVGIRIGKSGKPLFRIGHIQITDHLTLGVMKHMIDTEKFAPENFELETVCMPSWNPVQEALETGELDAACILAPIAMDLFRFGVPIKLVLFAHKNGSICVRKRTGAGKSDMAESFHGRNFFIPHILSIHHMLSSMFLSELGLKPGLVGEKDVDTFFEVVPPVKMPEFLATQSEAAGFTVAEPLGTKAIASGAAELVFLSGEMWEYHPCCVVVFRKECIDNHPEAVSECVRLLIESGQYIASKPEKAAEIAVSFLDPERKLGLNVPVLKNVLNEPMGIKTDDLYPVREDLDYMQKYMAEKMGVGSVVDLTDFVDTRFADEAYEHGSYKRRTSKLNNISSLVAKIAERIESGHKSKANLDREGKYLFFWVGREMYGINVMSIKEIIGLLPIKSVPQTPSYIKGVINLRGKVIPVVDMRTRFGAPDDGYTDKTCIIVVENAIHDTIMRIGIIVDSVSDVASIRAVDIEDTPSFGVPIDTSFILAIAKMNGTVRSLLNVNRMFTDNEKELIGNVV